MKLPERFLNRMKLQLGDKEYEAFLASYDLPRYYGLRVNTLKIGVEDFLKISPFEMEPIPWSSDGFYYKENESPGRHPYYHAGLYYIQEPSAMLPAEAAGAQPGERVLDLCAAPGGKTLRLAAAMKGKGLLVSNDISTERVKALVKNIELYGVVNTLVTNESPEVLERRFRGYFDRILIDAPCSGEGMFRKDTDAAASWEKFDSATCAAMQEGILESADKMLRSGGSIIYSTCTFAPEEDERMIGRFLETHQDYEVVRIPAAKGFERGRPEWGGGNQALSDTIRLWPHKVKGEGHFTAHIRKTGQEYDSALVPDSRIPPQNSELKAMIDAFRAFASENLNIEIDGNFTLRGNNLYCLPAQVPALDGIKTVKTGWYLGEMNHGRFEPSHSLATALKMGDIKNTVNFNAASREITGYLKGETILLEGRKGFTAVCVDGYTVGWAKQTGDMLKNLYPKGWRRMG